MSSSPLRPPRVHTITVAGTIQLGVQRDPYAGAAVPPAARALVICCPDCRTAAGLAVSWDRPDDEPARRSDEVIPVRMWCPRGHRWDDALQLGLLRAVLSAERQDGAPETAP